jgi:hypothetical protein
VLFGPQRLPFGMHSPPQLPLEQMFGQTAPSTQAPVSSQVCVVRLFAPLQRFVPGLQVPVHWPCPEQTFGQGIAAGTHSPLASQLSGVWLAPQWTLLGVHIPAQAPAVHTAPQVSFITHAPATVHTSTMAPAVAQRVVPALQAGPLMSPDGSGPSPGPAVPPTGASAPPPVPPVPAPPPVPPVAPLPSAASIRSTAGG